MSLTEEQFYRQPWMTDDHWRCASLLARVFGGFHHMGDVRQYADGVGCMLHQRDLATFDFNHLTALVVLAHQRCIRVSVCVAGMKLQARAYPRTRTGNMTQRHPTMEQAIAALGDEP
jgi:hypothetical protein